MVKAKDVRKDWERFRQPQPLFSIFTPTEEKIKTLASHIFEDELNMSDELRRYDLIYGLIAYYLYNSPSVLYEIAGSSDDFAGIIGFVDIVPRFKCSVIWKLWDKSVFNKSFVRQTQTLCSFIMNNLELKRMNADTPDPRVVKLAKLCGFKVEGERKNDFMFHKELYSTVFLGIEKEG